MTKDNIAFLAGGIAFGFVIGYGVFHAVTTRPSARLAAGGSGMEASGPAGPAAPSGPMAPTQMGQDGSAPMLREINALKQRLQAAPDDVAVLTRLANIYQDAGMHRQAVTFYEKAVALSPNDPNLITDYGGTLQALGDSDRALLQFARAQQVDPRHWQSLFNTAIVLGFSFHRYDEAEAAIQRVEELVGTGNPDVARLREALAADQKRVGGS